MTKYDCLLNAYNAACARNDEAAEDAAYLPLWEEQERLLKWGIALGGEIAEVCKRGGRFARIDFCQKLAKLEALTAA